MNNDNNNTNIEDLNDNIIIDINDTCNANSSIQITTATSTTN